MTDPFPALLDHLLDGQYLTGAQAESVMDDILSGSLGPERMAAFVTAMRAKSPAVDELVGFARSMRRHAHTIDAGTGGPVLDNCGTGGATCKSFNISTAAAFVVAGGGHVVAKHGNRSVTRPSGSADVLERAGADLDLGPEQVERVLRNVGIAFLFAPTFHPAMRHAGPVRKALGIKTVFNLLGPLTNPAGATHQVLGVYDPDYVPLIGNALARLGCRSGYVLHGEPGFDEASPCGPVLAARIIDGACEEPETIDPGSLGIGRAKPAELAAVPAEDAPHRLRAILNGVVDGPVADTVALNAAFLLHAAGAASDLADGLEEARRLMADGVGSAKLDAYVAATQSP